MKEKFASKRKQQQAAVKSLAELGTLTGNGHAPQEISDAVVKNVSVEKADAESTHVTVQLGVETLDHKPAAPQQTIKSEPELVS